MHWYRIGTYWPLPNYSVCLYIQIIFALVSTHHLFITASHLVVGIGCLTNKALCFILGFLLVFPIYWSIKVLGSVPRIT